MRLVNSTLEQPLVRRPTSRTTKRASEMAGRQRAFSREVPGRKISLQTCADQLFRAPFLPCGKPALAKGHDAFHASVRLGDVRAQSETDIIREEQGNPVGCVEHRQKQSRELRHDVIHDTHAWNKLQIGDSWRARVLSDYIQGVPPQEIVHRVERVMKEKLRV